MKIVSHRPTEPSSPCGCLEQHPPVTLTPLPRSTACFTTPGLGLVDLAVSPPRISSLFSRETTRRTTDVPLVRYWRSLLNGTTVSHALTDKAADENDH